MKKLTLIVLALFLVSASTQLNAQNFILNPDCEDSLVNGEIPHWIEVIGENWTQRHTDPEPYSGNAYFFPGVASIAELIQDVNVSNYAVLIDDSLKSFVFEGYVRSWPQNPPDYSRIVIEYLDITQLIKLDSIDFGNYWTTSSWVQLIDTSFAPSGTRFIRIRLISTRNSGSNNDGYYDALILRFDGLYAAFTVSDDTICEGDTVSFTDLSSDNVISWNWTFEGGTPGTSTVQNPSVTYNTMGTYDVQLVVSDGTDSDTLLAEDYIYVSAIPAQPNTPSGPAETCESGSYDYTTDPVTYASEYNWMVEPSDAGSMSGTGTTGTFTAALGWTGPYTVKVRAENDCGIGSYSNTFAANLNHTPVAYLLEGGGGYCEGDPGRELTLENSETGVDYELYYEGAATGNIVVGTGAQISFGFVTDEGIYTAVGFTATCENNMSGTPWVYVIEDPLQAATPDGPIEVCNDGGQTSYTTEGAINADTYNWYISPSEAGTIEGNDLEGVVTWDPTFIGLAYISVEGENECAIGLLSAELEVETFDAAEPEVSGLELVCNDEEADYSTSDNSGSTYTWEVTGGEIIAGIGTYMITVKWGDPGTGYVSVTEMNSDDCSETDELEVTIDDCTGIDELVKGQIKVYPNPVKNVLNIDLSTIQELKDGKISLINIHGHVINSVKVTEGLRNISINTSGVAPGLYWVQIVEDDQIIGARKVVIVR